MIVTGVNASLTGSGTLTVECGVFFVNPPSGCTQVAPGFPYFATVPLNFNSTTTSLGTISGSSNATSPSGAPPASAQIDGALITSATTNSLTAMLIDTGSLESTFDFTAAVQDSVAFSFDLTTESQLDVAFFNPISGGPPASGSGQLFDSMHQSILTIPFSGASIVLAPGDYELDESGLNSFSQRAFPLSMSYEDGAVDAFAEFTPIVPEPRWTFFAPALLLVFSRSASRRMRNLYR